MKTISEKYGVKLEAFRSSGTIRITSGRELCEDVFRLLKYTVENIQETEYNFPQTKDILLDTLQRLDIVHKAEESTSTRIRPVSTDDGYPRVSLFYHIEGAC